jgi:hypothetical protein
LTRIAACLHKLGADVGAKAVPGKLNDALEALRDAPDDWCGIDLARLREELDALAEKIAPVAGGAAVPVGLRFPVPHPLAD